MPLIKRYKFQESEIMIWEINEDYSYFQNKLEFTSDETNQMAKLTNKRLIEWLMPRYLLSVLLDIDHKDYYKDKYGKPHIANNDIHISISHSGKYFTLLHSSQNCGIDIQCYNSKIELIKLKFVNDIEMKWLENKEDHFTLLHHIWSAKEAIYKAYGRKQISLKGNIYVSDSILNKESCSTLQSENEQKKYKCHNLSNSIYSLIYATENN